MTKKDALTAAISALTSDEYTEVREVLSHMLDQLSVVRQPSDAAKQAAKDKRKEERAAAMTPILPVIRVAISDEPKTAKEIFDACADALPADYNERKVQYILGHELASEVDKVEDGRNPLKYRWKKA